MVTDSSIDRAVNQLINDQAAAARPNNHPRQHSSRSTSNRRRRSLSISSVASGFSHEDLVRPTLTFADDHDSLMALPPPSRIPPNRSWIKRITHVHHYPQTITLPLTCLSIALNALTANGPYVWPTYGPIVIERLGLSVTQGSTIALGGVLGTYLGAAPLGRFSDKKGPRAASLLSAVLSFVGYQSFSLLLVYRDRFTATSLQLGGDPDVQVPFSPLPLLLALSYFCLGGAAIGAYFSTLTTAALNFPRYPTLALSLPLSCYGLSSLTLSSLAKSKFFWDDEGRGLGQQLDPVRFTRFLGILVPGINLFAAIWLFVSPSAVERYPEDPTLAREEDEREPLLEDVQEEASDDDEDQVGDVSMANSMMTTRTTGTTNSNFGPDLSASISRELDNHRYRRASQQQQQHRLGLHHLTSSPAMRSQRLASIASSHKILDPNERTPLLIGGPEALYASVVDDAASVRFRANKAAAAVGDRSVGSVRDVERANGTVVEEESKYEGHAQVEWDFKSLGMDKGLWAFGIVMLLGVGPAEMVFSNIGSILNSLIVDPIGAFAKADASLDDPTIDRSLALRSHHVLLLSISSTVARLATGIIVDYISPVVVDESIDLGRRRRVVRRSMLAAGCLAVLAGAFLWGATGVKTVKGLDGLSIGVGGMYGAVFTITPAITSKHFGPGHFGLAWGMVSYFVAAGAIFFSYLYAFISEFTADRQSHPGSPSSGGDVRPTCQGPVCFGPTFWVSAVSCALGAVGMVLLGKRWKL